MSQIHMYLEELQVSLRKGPDIVNIFGELTGIVRSSGISDGSLHATVTGSTGSITTIEYEPGVVEDLKRAIERLAPPGLDYEHEKAWQDGNGHSHVQAALLGPSLVIPVREGRLKLGTWQQPVLINHDNRARTRRVQVSVFGTG